MRQGSKLPLLIAVAFLCLLTACGPDNSNTDTPYLNFASILPEEWQHVETYRFDTNHDGKLEWVVLYRFDLSDETKLCNSPIAAVVYQLNRRKPPCVIPYELYPQGDPNRHYLCEYNCTVAMDDVLSGLTGPELLVRDHRDDEMVRLSIFYWEPGKEEYQPRGHFFGHRITVALDRVTVDQCLPGRAQLAMRTTYFPRENETYYQDSGQGIPVEPNRHELIFCQGEPKDVVLSLYPEKIVLAFYNHYAAGNEGEVSKYFTDTGWEQLEHCAANRCGCSVARGEIEHVQVTQLQPLRETYSQTLTHQCENYGPDRALVQTAVVCKCKECTEDAETIVLWHFVREGDCWKLNNAEMMPAEGEEEGEQ